MRGDPFRNAPPTAPHALLALDARHNPSGGTRLGTRPAAFGDLRSNPYFALEVETGALAHREQPAASLLRGLYQVDLIAIRVLKIKPFYA